MLHKNQRANFFDVSDDSGRLIATFTEEIDADDYVAMVAAKKDPKYFLCSRKDWLVDTYNQEDELVAAIGDRMRKTGGDRLFLFRGGEQLFLTVCGPRHLLVPGKPPRPIADASLMTPDLIGEI